MFHHDTGGIRSLCHLFTRNAAVYPSARKLSKTIYPRFGTLQLLPALRSVHSLWLISSDSSDGASLLKNIDDLLLQGRRIVPELRDWIFCVGRNRVALIVRVAAQFGDDA
jgi:hypothetical protein